MARRSGDGLRHRLGHRGRGPDRGQHQPDAVAVDGNLAGARHRAGRRAGVPAPDPRGTHVPGALVVRAPDLTGDRSRHTAAAGLLPSGPADVDLGLPGAARGRLPASGTGWGAGPPRPGGLPLGGQRTAGLSLVQPRMGRKSLCGLRGGAGRDPVSVHADVSPTGRGPHRRHRGHAPHRQGLDRSGRRLPYARRR